MVGIKDECVKYEIPEFGRVYEDEDGERYPSVTTVTDFKKDEQKDKNIQNWKDKNDGEDGNAYHETIKKYKSIRGTLVHLHLLDDVVEKDLREPEHDEVEEQLREMGEIRKHNDDELGDAYEKFQDDLEFCEEQWERITNILGISKDTTIDSEFQIQNLDVGYRGTADLLWEENLNGKKNTVLTDLKTSKNVYWSNKAQLVMYANAMETPVDKLQIIRIHPDGEFVPEWQRKKYGYTEVEISEHTDWDESLRNLWRTGKVLTKKANEALSEIPEDVFEEHRTQL